MKQFIFIAFLNDYGEFMNLFLKNKVFRWIIISDFLNNSGASIYNIVFVIFASTMPNPRIMVFIANAVVLIPIFFQISVGIRADKTERKVKWAINIGFCQAILFIIVALLQRNMSYLAFSAVCFINIISDTFSNLERGLKMPILQKNIPQNTMMAAFSFKQFVTYISSLLGQIFGVWLLSVSYQNFSFVAIINAVTFLLSVFSLMIIRKEMSFDFISADSKDSKTTLTTRLKSILSNARQIFGKEGASGFTRMLSCIILVNVLGSAILPIFNIVLLDKTILNLPFGTSILIMQSAYILGVIVSSLLPNDVFSKLSLTTLISFVSASLLGLSALNMSQFPALMSTIFIVFIGYVIGKINPKLSSQLLNALSPEVLAQTGAFLDTLFMLSIPVGTVMFTSLTLWHVKISWFIFSILSLVALILILTTHKRKQKNEAI
ncbi:MAG: transporter [Lactococcus lactis]|nr:transporter [Clostridia bacterium]MBR3209895.1 transporter [Bacilli bacterium]MDN5441460.1 transporter [Lactococcus lactis]MDN5474757.1 transporter [Lactococcus lactis]